MAEPQPSPPRQAHCACGALSATVRVEPVEVYLCSCLDCQRLTGSSVSYCAMFPDAAVTLDGASKTWRHSGESGRWVENRFCPACGTAVLFRLQIVPGMIGVSVGCFADPHFAAPTRQYWASRQHDWLALPNDVERLDRQ
jgi:hypothetical protein